MFLKCLLTGGVKVRKEVGDRDRNIRDSYAEAIVETGNIGEITR